MDAEDRFEGAEEETRYYGKYRAFVRDFNDPEKRMRLRAYCPAVMGPLDDSNHWLDWAEGCFATGGVMDQGHVAMPVYGAGIWIEFEMGNPEYPIWTGTWFAGSDSGSSEVPLTAKGDGDESAGAPKGTDVAQEYVIDEENGVAVEGDEYQESLSPYATIYPHNKVIKTASGHVIELDDTDGQERIHVYHKAGTYIEINADGGVTEKSISNKHEIVTDKHVIHDAKERIMVVDGALGETVAGLVSQVYLDGVRQLVTKECNKWFKSIVNHVYDADLKHEVGGSFSRRVANNFSNSVVGTGSDFFYGAYDFVTLEKMSFQAGNTGLATNSIEFLAQTGNILHQALIGKIQLDTLVDSIELHAALGDILLAADAAKIRLEALVDNIELKASAGDILQQADLGDIKLDALAGSILASAVTNIELAATAVAKINGTAGVEVDGAAVGVKIGSAAVEPLVLGTKLHTAAVNLATAVSSQQLVGNLGLPVPTAPAAPGYVAFAAAVLAALSPLNKVA